MLQSAAHSTLRCLTCGHAYAETDKFCSECGRFLRDAYIDERLLLSLTHLRDGRTNEARQELQRLLQSEPGHVLGNHCLGTLYFHEGLLDMAVLHYTKSVTAAPNFVLGHYDR